MGIRRTVLIRRIDLWGKLRTLEKCSNVKKLRTAEPQLIFTGSYKKKKVYIRNGVFKRTVAIKR